jgi:hypothetical protein
MGRKGRYQQDENVWWFLQDGRPVLPAALGRQMLMRRHQPTHLRSLKTAESLRPIYYIPQLDRQSCHRHGAYASFVYKETPKEEEKPPKESMPKKALPENTGKWSLPMVLKYKYFFIFIDTFSAWVEAYPTWMETASVVTKKLLQELIPRFELLLSLGFKQRPSLHRPSFPKSGKNF